MTFARVGHSTRFISACTSVTKLFTFIMFFFFVILAGETGIEPATYGFGDRHSTS